jgi:predicted aspartyl protease
LSLAAGRAAAISGIDPKTDDVMMPGSVNYAKKKKRVVLGLCWGHALRLPIFAAIVSLACSNTNQAHAEPACKIDLQAALNLRFVNNLAVVETKINGVPATLGLDTGAKTLVTPEAALGRALTRNWQQQRTIGTTAILLAHTYTIEDLEFAGRHYHNKSVPAIALPRAKNAIESVNGLIGTDILADFDLDFDFPNKKLNVYRVTGCKTVTPPGFTAASSMRFSFNDQRGAVLAAELDGKKITALLDTGAVNFAITRTAARRLKVTASTVNTDLALDATGAGNVTVKQLQHQFRSLTIGSETIPDPLFGIINTPVTSGDILLGQRFLFTRRFFISNATRTLFLGEAPAPAPAFTFKPSTVLRLSPEKNGDRCKDSTRDGSCLSAASAKPEEKAPAPASAGTPSTSLAPPPERDGGRCKDGQADGVSGNCTSTANAKPGEMASADTPATPPPLSLVTGGIVSAVATCDPSTNPPLTPETDDGPSTANASPEKEAHAPAFTYRPSTVLRLPPKKE